jgi:hypothetical protein
MEAMQSHFAQLQNMYDSRRSPHVRIGAIKTRIHRKQPYNSLYIEVRFARGIFRECRRELGDDASALRLPFDSRRSWEVALVLNVRIS